MLFLIILTERVIQVPIGSIAIGIAMMGIIAVKIPFISCCKHQRIACLHLGL
jgi:hypothetical protein